MAALTEGDPAQALWVDAQVAAATAHISFGTQCARGVIDMIELSVYRVTTDEEFASAQLSIRMVVGAMVADARQRGMTVLGESTLAAALGHLCPLYPFC